MGNAIIRRWGGKLDVHRLAVFLGFLSGACGGLAFSIWLYAGFHELPPRNEVEDWPGYYRAVDAPLTGWDDPRLQRWEDETILEFAERAARAVHNSGYNCQPGDSPDWLSQSLSVFNILQFKELGVLTPKYFRCGYCHQRAYILSRTLRNNGIAAKTYGLHGHVVTVFTVESSFYIADSDYGVGPFEVDVTDNDAMKAAAARHYAFLNDDDSIADQKNQYRLVLLAYDRTDLDRRHRHSAYLDTVAERQERLLDQAETIRTLVLLAAIAFTAVGAWAIVFGWRGRKKDRQGSRKL